MLYEIRDGTVSPGGMEVLSHVYFQVKGREKLALVGANGAGKTTLLKLMAGELVLDRDDRRKGPGIITDRKLAISRLKQTGEETGTTLEEWIAQEKSPEQELEFWRLLTRLGIDKSHKRRKISDFSGGEQEKIFLAGELARHPDILLLDEPTNHLDIGTTEYLEEYLRDYDRAVVVVSHDRFFLDRVVDGVWELSGGKLTFYSGNYTGYRKQKSKNLQIARKQYDRQQAEIERLNRLIERFKHKPKKAAFARSRKSMIDRMEKVKPPQEDAAYTFSEEIFPVRSCSKWVVTAEKLKIGYRKNDGGGFPKDRTAWTRPQIDLRILRGQKIGIIGANGVGKTTLLKTIAGSLEPLAGECRLGERVEMGVFDQHTARIDDEVSVFDHFHERFPGKTAKEVRGYLAGWLFRGRQAEKRVCDLSGGEKSRLILAELLAAGPNLLLLDEPTNHMDIPAKETIESALLAYRGTLLFISHDRYFVRQVARSLLVMDEDEVWYYPFGYEHYINQCSRRGLAKEPLSALVRAEEKAMVEGLRAVPEAERHRLREIGTDQAGYEWELRLAGEAVDEAFARVDERQKIWITEGSWDEKKQFLLEKAEKEWTDACLRWYTIYTSDYYGLDNL